MIQKFKLIAFILILLAIPLTVVLAQKVQNFINQAAAPQEEKFSEGNQEQSVGRDFSSDPAVEKQTAVVRTFLTTPSNPGLKKEVYAYVPYWEINSETDTYLQYKYMTHLIYHGISLGKNGVINKTNGPWNVWEGAQMTEIVENARESGVKVLPNIVLFNSGGNTGLNDFLDNANARNKAVTQIINFLKTSPQPVDGVALDFEYPGTSQKEELTDFMKKLREEMKKNNSEWVLTTAVSGYSYSGGGTDLVAIAPHVDSFFVMSYHLRNPSSAEKAGSTNPIGALKTLTDGYLSKIPGNKVVLGFPMYLSEWKTVDDSLHSKKRPGTGGGKTVPGTECGFSTLTCTRLAQRYMKTYGKKYDNRDKSAYYSVYDCIGDKKGWKQVYFDDEEAFTDKFKILINDKNLRGVGFWAQNYDKGYLDTWKAIYNAFGDKSILGAPQKKPGFETPNPVPNNGCAPPPSETPTPTPVETFLDLKSVKLHGIGKGGDNVNPTGLGNQNPLRKTRSLTVELYASDVLISSAVGNITYAAGTGDFKGKIKMPRTLTSGDYLIKVFSQHYLKKQLTGVINITKGTTNQAPAVSLTAGDSNSDGERNLLDFDILSDCYSDPLPPRDCSTPAKKISADLTDDGKVDHDDFSLFIRELSVLAGD